MWQTPLIVLINSDRIQYDQLEAIFRPLLSCCASARLLKVCLSATSSTILTCFTECTLNFNIQLGIYPQTNHLDQIK